jgi:methylmalonyl-CoA mutase N-terminal domain/subunit
MKKRFGAKDPRSWRLRFHTQTAGSTLTAQQPENNVIRVTMQALAAILGGTQSLHTNSRDEALALPTADAVQIALRTQQIIAHESGVADTIDPLGGSYFIESLTDELEACALAYIEEIDQMGGMMEAIDTGFVQYEIQEAAYSFQCDLEANRAVVVGVNRFSQEHENLHMEMMKLDPAIEEDQRQRLAKLRQQRDDQKVAELRNQVEAAARSGENLMPKFITCVENMVTLGEICHSLRAVWGEYRPDIAL